MRRLAHGSRARAADHEAVVAIAPRRQAAFGQDGGQPARVGRAHHDLDGVAGELGHGALAAHPAAGDDDDAVDELLDLAEPVAGQQHGAAAPGALAQQRAQPVHALGIEAIGRLVEHQDARIAEQRRRDVQSLAHAQRVALHPAMPRGGEPDEVEHLIDARFVDADRARDDAQVVASAPARVEAALLEDRAHRPRRLLQRGVGRAADRGAAGRRAHEAEERAQRRGLAGAVGAQEARHLAGRDAEREVLDGRRRPVALGQPVHLEGRRHRASVASSRPPARFGSSMRRVLVLTAVLLALPATAARAETVRAGSVYARISATDVVLGNSVAERRWTRDGLVTAALVDKRGKDRTWSAGRRDFALDLAGRADVGSERFTVTSAKASKLARGGLRVTMELASPVPGLTATRSAEAYPGIAGFRTQTILHPAAGLALSGATLDEAAVPGAAPTLHAFRAGSDWREPDWSGPPVSIGDPHAGDWRDTHTAPAGHPLAGPGQWLDLDRGGRRLFLVMERNDLPSSRAEYDGASAQLRIDYARDILSLGPLEEDGHAENPAPPPAPGRARVLAPGEALALSAAFTGFGTDGDDAAWQFHRYLAGHRVEPWAHDVIFNSDGTDANRISTGAKDDMDLATVQQVAPLARRLGVDTFVLDDGWQAASGDWQPDSPQYPEPRGKFPPRFPDATFAAVRQAIAPMKLGLWMSPLSFNPSSATYQSHPQWACAPLGDATAALGALQPDDGSNEAGIGLWGADALPHIQSRLEDAIQHWGVRFFKFDFIVWTDCPGQNDLWELHDRFVSMLDTLRAKYPDVVFQIDETNDYRLFPFESVSRGPTWFTNGGPNPVDLLHNVWTLSPWIPAYALGQKTLSGNSFRSWPVDTAMAAALPSEMLFAGDLRAIPADVIDAAAPWIAFAHAHERELGGVTY